GVLDEPCGRESELHRAKPPRRDSELPLERAREMALVAETRFDGDERERLVGRDELAGRPLDPEAADVLAERLAVAGAERTCEVGRVDADLRGDARRVDRLEEALANRRADALDPALGAWRDVAPSRDRDQLEREALQRQPRERVGSRELPADAERDENGVGGRRARHRPAVVVRGLDDDDRRSRPAEAILVRLLGWHRDQRALAGVGLE